jgi:hypothetical protein
VRISGEALAVESEGVTSVFAAGEDGERQWDSALREWQSWLDAWARRRCGEAVSRVGLEIVAEETVLWWPRVEEIARRFARKRCAPIEVSFSTLGTPARIGQLASLPGSPDRLPMKSTGPRHVWLNIRGARNGAFSTIRAVGLGPRVVGPKGWLEVADGELALLGRVVDEACQRQQELGGRLVISFRQDENSEGQVTAMHMQRLLDALAAGLSCTPGPVLDLFGWH